MVISGQVRSRVGELYIWLFWRHIPNITTVAPIVKGTGEGVLALFSIAALIASRPYLVHWINMQAS